MKPAFIAVSMQIAILSFALLINANSGSAQNTHSEQPYYVIVGGFSSRDNAERFTERLHEQNYPARYALNINRKLYYVYVRLTTDRQYAKQLAHHLRIETKFQDAWIYNGTLDDNGVLKDAVLADVHRLAEPVNLVERPIKVETRSLTVASTVAIEPIVFTAPSAVGKRFMFQVTNTADNKPVDGVVYLLESERDAHFLACNTNEKISVPAPDGGKLIVVCDLLGYKFAKRAINYADPVKSIKDASIGDAEEVIIPIRLAPVTKGDYMELEHVKFIDNSAILTPTSEPELMALTRLMSNPRCKIKLFGHTYNRADCDIISLGNSTQFFSLDPTNNDTHHGSARELSYQRAETVKAYLVSKGVEPERIATKGYGAALVIYEDPTANERIEVRITRN